MIKKKVCMLGAFAAGKTSLVNRFAHGVFSEDYYSTVGVRVEKKVIEIEGTEVNLILWDLHGEDAFQKVRVSYVRGSSGCIYVIDGTRRETVDVAFGLMTEVEEAVGPLPSIVVVNKRDLAHEWELETELLDRLSSNHTLVRTSAKTGQHVSTAFGSLARHMLGRS